MITFELENEYGGWKMIAIPDDLRFVVQTSAGSVTLCASLEELLRAYGHVNLEEDGVVGVYTSALEFTFHDGRCRLGIEGHSVQVDTSELKDAFETLLSEVFRSKDETDPENRTEQLAYVSSKLQEKGIGYDVGALYEALVAY